MKNLEEHLRSRECREPLPSRVAVMPVWPRSRIALSSLAQTRLEVPGSCPGPAAGERILPAIDAQTQLS